MIVHKVRLGRLAPARCPASYPFHIYTFHGSDKRSSCFQFFLLGPFLIKSFPGAEGKKAAEDLSLTFFLLSLFQLSVETKPSIAQGLVLFGVFSFHAPARGPAIDVLDLIKSQQRSRYAVSEAHTHSKFLAKHSFNTLL